jgi:hypothetical protein
LRAERRAGELLLELKKCERSWQAKRQMRQSLPRRVAALEKANAELRKEVKGLK